MKSKILFTISLLLILITHTYAQTSQTNYFVKGIVHDSVTQKPVDYITVNLKSAANQLVKTTITKPDGSFSFEKIGTGKYSISLISVGYISKVTPVDLTDSIRSSFDLGVVLISPQNNQLKAVSVTADKPIIKQEVDRITYDMQADPESKVLNVLEMMRKVPLLSLDGEDNIQLKGNSNYKILINGRPSSMIDRSPRDILRSMPATSIKSIEVITTPPSKYDSEGLAGIINIITNKRIDNGYNATISPATRFPTGGPGVGASFTVKEGKFGISGFTGAYKFNFPDANSAMSRVTTGANPTNLVLNNIQRSNSKNGYFGSEFSYEIDSLNLISGQLNPNWNKSYSHVISNSRLNNQGGIIQGYDLQNNSDGGGNGIDGTLNYQLGFKSNKNRLLTLSYRYYDLDIDGNNNLTVSNPVNYSVPSYNQVSQSSSKEQTFQIDYVHPLKKINIEAGIKGILRDNNSDFQYSSYNASSGSFITDPARSNKYNNDQNIFGAYNTYQYNLKNWGFKAGIRVEETSIKADFISSSSSIDQNYFNIIPTVTVNRKLKNQSSLNLGFTQRIQRPGINNLNPFVDRSRPNVESSGNPLLRPVLSNNIDFNYSKFKKGSINLGMTYSFANNTIQYVYVFDAANNVTRSTYQNIGKNRYLISSFNMNYPINKKLSSNLGGKLMYLWVEGTVNGLATKNKGLNGSYSAGLNYRFDSGWRLNGFLNYIGSNISLQGSSSPFYSSAVSTSKDLIKDKLTLGAVISNPIDKYRNFRSETSGIDFLQTSTNRNYFRVYGVNLNYRFGKLKDDIKKNKRGINNDDAVR